MIPVLAAVDWGTSGFRLWLLSADGAVLAERKSRQGMSVAAGEGFATVLASHLEAAGAPAGLPVIICGMAGARQGWVEAGYADVPTGLADLATRAVRVADSPAGDTRILPGLAQRLAERADVMRGEETQLMGSGSAILTGRHAVCMPGTHSKWVSVDEGTVTGFSTFMTGEVFAALSGHTILKHATGDSPAFEPDHPAFADAVARAFAEPGRLTSQIFSVRASGLLFGTDAAHAAASLSGSLIGAELGGALAGNASAADSLVLVAEGRLATLYSQAFAAIGLSPRLVDADRAVLAGLVAAANTLWPGLVRQPA